MGIARPRSPEDKEYHERGAMVLLNRIMSKPATQKPRIPVAERRLNTEEVLRAFGVKRYTLWARMRTGHFPPPLKGLAPAPGQDPMSWHRLSKYWPASLIYAAAAGVFDDRLPMAPDEWAALMRDKIDFAA